MLNTTNIIRLVIKRDKELATYSGENRDTIERLGYFKRNKFIKIRDLIYNITNTIERESGWMYTPSKFTCYSDFSYTGDEIVFKTNTVTASDNGYELGPNPTDREKAFFERYKEVLKRLFELEERRREMLPRIPENVIPFNSIQTRADRIKENKENIFTANFSNYLAFAFVRDNHSKGILELVRLLNMLTDSPDYMRTYRSMYPVSGPYQQDLLSFAGLYTPRGQQVLDELARERLEKAYYLSGFPTMEERMTKNMIDLHL